jgi:putative membrane protein
LLSEAELAEINQAVLEAERKTAGEIVPVLATAAGSYERGLFYAGLMFALLATLSVVAFYFLPLSFLAHDPWSVPLYVLLPCQVAGLLAGYHWARRSPGLHRAFIPHAVLQRRVNQAARRAFLEHRLADTRHATGVMIYAALFERIVVVLADKSINEKHDQATWDALRDLLLDGFRRRRPAEGYARAIAECGRILQADFPIQEDDVNELPNHLRVI